MKVIPIPCLNDNFAYLLICPETNEAAVVDPSEYEPVFKEVKNRKVTLTSIFNTHHHWDHVGGNDELSRHFPGIKIHAHISDRDRVPGPIFSKMVTLFNLEIKKDPSSTILDTPQVQSPTFLEIWHSPETPCFQEVAEGFLRAPWNKCIIL